MLTCVPNFTSGKNGSCEVVESRVAIQIVVEPFEVRGAGGACQLICKLILSANTARLVYFGLSEALSLFSPFFLWAVFSEWTLITLSGSESITRKYSRTEQWRENQHGNQNREFSAQLLCYQCYLAGQGLQGNSSWPRKVIDHKLVPLGRGLFCGLFLENCSQVWCIL